MTGLKNFMDVCRYCNLPVENPVRTLAYWNQTPDVCHAGCREAGEREEAFDCQVVDADCNDCRFYRRGKLAGKIVSKLHRQDGTVAEVVHQPNIFTGGHCLKFDREVVAQPKKWSGFPCFEHRRQAVDNSC